LVIRPVDIAALRQIVHTQFSLSPF